MTETRGKPTDRAERLSERLAIPVLVAALASIPATFLTLLDEPLATAGSTLNTVSGAVLIAETVVLLAVAGDKRAWLRDNKWLVGLTLVIVPAVVFAVGPVQLLRLVRVFGALRIVRVRRIVKAGKIIRERHNLTGPWARALTLVLTLAAAAFVAIVLADPTSDSRQWLEQLTARVGLLGILIAGAILGIATYVVRTKRDDEDDERDGSGADDRADASARKEQGGAGQHDNGADEGADRRNTGP